MEPRIQYAKTEDGVSIAYWTLGEGMPLVHMPAPPWSHIQLEWQWPEYRRGEEVSSGLLLMTHLRFRQLMDGKQAHTSSSEGG